MEGLTGFLVGFVDLMTSGGDSMDKGFWTVLPICFQK